MFLLSLCFLSPPSLCSSTSCSSTSWGKENRVVRIQSVQACTLSEQRDNNLLLNKTSRDVFPNETSRDVHDNKNYYG